MRFWALLSFGVTATLLLAAAGPAREADAPPSYLLSMRLHDGQRLVGAPRMTVTSGEMATVAIGETAGDHCRVSVTAMPREGGRVAITSVVDVVEAGRHRSAAPAMTVRLGQPSRIAIGHAPGAPFRIEMTLVRAG